MICRIIILVIILFMTACQRQERDHRLSQIAEIVSESPREALSYLDSIDYSNLSSSDQHYFDFLSIKAKDKAYIVHKSDSLILDIISYYSNKDKNIYSEALYYGGRVYSDLGDFPTALYYFQTALDNLSYNVSNKRLRSKILSQTGRLLNSLRLYEEAIPYIKEAIIIEQQINDSINELYDLQLLGAVYLRAHDFPNAEAYFHIALDKSAYLPPTYKAKSLMYLAGVKFRIGQIDSALLYIRDTPNLVNPIARNSALACAAEIYHSWSSRYSL